MIITVSDLSEYVHLKIIFSNFLSRAGIKIQEQLYWKWPASMVMAITN